MRPSFAVQATLIGLLVAADAVAEARAGDAVSFVACPIAQERGPEEDLCFFAEHRGERYSLRTQIVEDVGPLLKHKILVEGVVRDAERVCGALQLEGMASAIRAR